MLPRSVVVPLLLLALVSPLPALAGELPSIDTPLKTGKQAVNDAAVVIGVEDYAFLPSPPYARRDAEAMYQFLQYTRGVPAQQMELLVKGTSRTKIERAVEAAGKAVGPGGTVWVYFAGHGSASPSTKERILLPSNTTADDDGFEESGVRVKDLQVLAGASGAEVMLITDACFTGAGRGGASLRPGGRSIVPAAAIAAGRSAQWDAAQANEVAGPLDAVQHGAFTYFAIGAMRGWADGHVSGTVDGTVTTDEAQAYVADALRAVGLRDQSPSLVGATAYDRDLASFSRSTSGKVGGERAPELSDLNGAVGTPVVAKAAVAVPRTGDAKVQTDGRDMDFAALAAAAQEASAEAAREKAAAEAAEVEGARTAREAAETAAKKAATAKALQDELERRLAAERAEKIEAASAELRAAATRDYAAISSLVANPTPEGRPVLEAWLARYGSAKVTVDSQTATVEVPEAAAVVKALGRAGSGRDWDSPTLGVMKWIPAGSFLMGSPAGVGSDDERPQHKVTLTKGFWLMEHEVTQGEWQAVMGKNPAHFSGCGSSCPVEKVSWDDAHAFVKKVSARDGVNYRLPTEAEWEYAARGGQTYAYAGSNEVGSVGWYVDNSGETTHPGCGKARNGYGLCDMSGNVWEWTGDGYAADYRSAGSTDPAGPASGSDRVVRGGGYYGAATNAAVASRDSNALSNANGGIGIRLARSSP